MRTCELDYQLPPELIAQAPAAVRDESRLLVVDRAAGTLHDAVFSDLPRYLSRGDLLVLNDTRVVPAKIVARRASGGRIDGLFVHDRGDQQWEILLRGRGRLRVGEVLALEPVECEYTLVLRESLGRGRWLVRLNSADTTPTILERVGQTPLPPYIHRDHPDARDRDRYQTIFANRPGAVAAPTASLHFTDRLFYQLDRQGVERAMVTLHVGPGTFTPVAVEELDEHHIHAEWFDLTNDAVERMDACRARGARIVAAGTTSVRVLESCATADGLRAASRWTDLFIRPPYSFRVVDRLITNFHLPRSTLLALVMAFGGVELIRAAYEHAVAQRYRFYSYGDAMLIL